MKKNIFLVLAFFSSIAVNAQSLPDSAILKQQSPGLFKAVFHTTKGDFTIEVIRNWSPQGADRLYQLLKTGFYNNNGIFRVQTGYVIQFGICDHKEVNAFWDKKPIKDEPAKTPNSKGTISYARDGADSRTTQLFINLKDNIKLDTVNYNGVRGFTPVARITEGFDVVEKFYAGYGFEPTNHQDSVMVSGNAYLKKHFPEIDYILSVELLK
jgi:peptidyl-prolyl cis-trans isomerase A (cyclophilin A)